MGRVAQGVRKLAKTPGIPQARGLAERSVAPYLRADMHGLAADHGLTVDRLSELELKVDTLYQALSGLHHTVEVIESHQPEVLNAIASTNGTTRLLARRLNEKIEGGNDVIRHEMMPHIGTIAWLLQRVETVRAEMMHEFRYGPVNLGHDAAIETKIVNPAALESPDLRINFGAGHITLDGFINVDLRELPGIDVVAPVEDLPFAPASLTEIFSSHTVEHFPELELRRKLLPYWVGLLKPGGTFRAIVPDVEAMSAAYVDGTMSFEVFRSVLYGGQEYAGDFHFTGFTPDSLGAMLVEAGLQKPTVIAKGRPNGDCLEFEISASKPSG